ncbi:MAG: flagellar motor switch protein FliG [Candidatus Methylomirabilales bacterium]
MMSGLQKAAILLTSIGGDASIELFKHLEPSEVAQLRAEISRLSRVPIALAHSVMEEAQHLSINGGVSVQDRANGIIDDRQESSQGTLSVLKRIDPRDLVNFTRREHPQTLALILIKMDPSQAGKFLVELPPELQSDVVLRVANMDKIVPEVIEQIESVLEERLASVSQPEVALRGGAKAAAEILNHVGRAHEEKILESLQNADVALIENIRDLMFTFEDLMLVDDRGMQRVLREVNQRELAIALKTASEELRTKVLKNMSERAAIMLREEMEDLGPVRLREVEEEQQRMVALVRVLQEAGEIVVRGRGAEEDEEILV